MKLLKLLLIIFAVYFVRRAIQFYKAVKSLQEEQTRREADAARRDQAKNDKVVDAEYTVVDSN